MLNFGNNLIEVVNMDWLTFITSIKITKENKAELQCIIKELEALDAIEENEAEFILNGSECVGK